MTSKIFLLELNEINFDFVQKYVGQGRLPNFAQIIREHGIIKTTSEERYEELEPWIQWVTAHTGKSFAEHGVFRLGDIVDFDIEQIWEFLEQRGLLVGAISPMNASNRVTRPAFFLPDPWTKTLVSGSYVMKRLSSALSQAVNDNAQSRLGASALLWLLAGVIRYARFRNYGQYARHLLRTIKRQSWAKVQILEELLADLAIGQTRAKRPDFVSLFMNAGAHIQHHYMFNAGVYEGVQSNPEWLISKDADPILDIYSQYDRILGDLRESLPDYRLILATGLHQDPFPETKYYWRLRDHGAFLNLIGVEFRSVEPRMSRDFLVTFDSVETALHAQNILERVTAEDGEPVFEVDNRGDSLFVMLVYPHEIADTMAIRVGNTHYPAFRQHAAFVAIKNGEHNGLGYLIDTAERSPQSATVPLKDLPKRIAAGFGFDWPQEHSRDVGTKNAA